MSRSRGWKVLALAGALAGCGNSGESPPATENGSTTQPQGSNAPAESGKPAGMSGASRGRRGSEGAAGLAEVPQPTGLAAAALVKADSCDDLLARIQDDVAAKIDMQAELLRKEPDQSYPGGPIFGGRGVAESAGTAATPPPVAAPRPSAGLPMDPAGASADGDFAGNDSKGGSGPTDFSDTNVQVKGVDEADIVKTDGEHIYLLHGNQLFVLDSWPAESTAVTHQIDIEGGVQEMFVHDGKAVVFSSVFDQGDLLQNKPAPDADVAADARIRPGPFYGASFTKITVVDVGAQKPQVLRQVYVQGDYVSARRHENTVRTVIRDPSRFPEFYGGNIEYRDQWGRPYPQEDIDAQVDDWRDRHIAAVENTKLSDWLPAEREIIDGKLVTSDARCTDFYSPAPGLSNGGITNIVSFDLSKADSKLGGAVVLGMADEVYANDAVLVLAHRDWRFERMLIERERTVLHRFEIAKAETTYTASGSVPGHIVDQFSIDERQGVIRVATTARFWQDFVAPLPAVADAAAADDAAKTDPETAERKQTDNRVITLDVDGPSLTRLGTSKPLGKDGETIQSSRFVDDKAYVVTFERIDPLIVLDLGQPERPTILGQLNIPGFSEYMHPIDSDHLLTIGQDADAQGRVTGLMLQIFDVSDATKPRRTHSFRFGPGGYSEASQNHKAFTFHKPQGAEGFDGLLAFPYVNYNSNFSSTLQVFEVSIDGGFTDLGAIDHTRLLRDVCRQFDPQGVDLPNWYPCVQPDVRRGLFIFGDEGDFVYSVSSGGVLAHELSDLRQAVASVALPFPKYDQGIGIARPGVAVDLPVAMPPPTSPAPPAPEPRPTP